MKKQTRKIAKGDRVAYSRAFLQSTGQYGHARRAHRRGTVLEIEDLGENFLLARIQWEGEAEPSRVNVGNLVALSRLHLELV